MQGNFIFHNPTKVYFGKGSLENLSIELEKYGRKVLMVYGGGSIKRNGIYDAVTAKLEESGKQVKELPGVMPNPTSDKLMEGVAMLKEDPADLILAVGGGSVCDYCKALAASVHCEEDPWTYYFRQSGEMTCQWIPVGCVLTMAGTGSEMDACSVITNNVEKRKISRNFRHPDFSILDPTFTYSLPKRQTVAGIYDTMSHILEQYLSGTDDNTTDYIAEGMMRAVVANSRKALANPEDYEARSNLMWSATWALNGLLACGKTTDWMVHMLGKAVAAYTDETHGHTLSAVSHAYYRLLISRSDEAVAKFRRLAVSVWDVCPTGKTDKEVAMEGLEKMESWMDELGMARNITELGVNESQLEDIADACIITKGGYVRLTREDVIEVLRQSL